MKIITAKTGLILLAAFFFIYFAKAQKKRSNTNTQIEFPEALYSSIEKSRHVSGIRIHPNKPDFNKKLWKAGIGAIKYKR